MNDVGNALDKAQEAFDDLTLKRTKALDKPILRIDALRTQNGIEDVELAEIAEA
jgi:citrate lyase beta subunit